MPIDNGFFIHPQDRATQDTLRKIPVFNSALEQYWKKISKPTQHWITMGSKIRLGSGQLDEIYRFLPEVCDILEITEPNFYMEMDPRPDAYTFGDAAKQFVVITSGLADLLRPDELKTVIAHECGHIRCGHCLYHSVAQSLLELRPMAPGLKSGIAAAALLAVKPTLASWMRCSDLSSDRVAAYVMGDAECVMRTMMRLASGSPRIPEKIDMPRYLAQTEKFLSTVKEPGFLKKLLQEWDIKDQTQPFLGIRCLEVRDWFEQNRDRMPGKR